MRLLSGNHWDPMSFLLKTGTLKREAYKVVWTYLLLIIVVRGKEYSSKKVGVIFYLCSYNGLTCDNKNHFIKIKFPHSRHSLFDGKLFVSRVRDIILYTKNTGNFKWAYCGWKHIDFWKEHLRAAAWRLCRALIFSLIAVVFVHPLLLSFHTAGSLFPLLTNQYVGRY